MTPQALILDFDGVIVDSERLWPAAMDHAFSQLVSDWSTELNETFIGLSSQAIHTHLQKHHGVTLTYEEYLAHIDETAYDVYNRCVLVPGLPELLERAQAKGLPINIASSSQREWIEHTLKRLNIDGAFDRIVTAQEIEPGRGKPFPDIFLAAAKHAQTPPEHCLAIEDSNHGVVAAKAAGIYTVGLRNGFNEHQDLSVADEIVESLDDVLL